MSTTYYKKGTYNAVCEVCGFQHKADEMKERWDGLFVCKEDWEPRHPLDFARTVADNMSVKRPAPDPSPNYIDVPYLEE